MSWSCRLPSDDQFKIWHVCKGSVAKHENIKYSKIQLIVCLMGAHTFRIAFQEELCFLCGLGSTCLEWIAHKSSGLCRWHDIKFISITILNKIIPAKISRHASHLWLALCGFHRIIQDESKIYLRFMQRISDIHESMIKVFMNTSTVLCKKWKRAPITSVRWQTKMNQLKALNDLKYLPVPHLYCCAMW